MANPTTATNNETFASPSVLTCVQARSSKLGMYLKEERYGNGQMWCSSVSGECCQWMSEWRGDWRDGAVERDGSQWVSPKALTPWGFDAIFPRRESTWEELVNNICPSSGRLTPTPNPRTSTHSHRSAVNLSTSHKSHRSGQACPAWTLGPSRLNSKGLPETPATENQYSLTVRCSPKLNSSVTLKICCRWWLISTSEEVPDLSLRLRETLRVCLGVSPDGSCPSSWAGGSVMSPTSVCQPDLCNEFSTHHADVKKDTLTTLLLLKPPCSHIHKTCNWQGMFWHNMRRCMWKTGWTETWPTALPLLSWSLAYAAPIGARRRTVAESTGNPLNPCSTGL